MATALRPASVSHPIPFFSLSRITSSGNFIPEIDGLRFVAIAAVVTFHIYEYLISRTGISSLGTIVGTALTHGQRGVPLFFVISGFILGRPYAAHYLCGSPVPEKKEYYLRRITRLEPPYLLALIAVFVGLSTFSYDRGIFHLLASLAYSHNLIYGVPNPFFGLAWSLEIEVQFYCLIPLLALIYTLPRMARRSILATFMLIGVFHIMPMPSRLILSIFGWLQCFAAGMMLADLYVDHWNTNKHWVYDFTSITLWPAVFLMSDAAAWITLPLIALLLYIAAFRSILFNKLLTLPAVSTIGGMCYTIYLVHYPMISLAGRLFKGPASIFILLSTSLIAAASFLFFLLIERPCMDKHWPLKLVRYLPIQKINAE